ncbi:MAG: dihydrofolate reductase [Gammaproteobacteria bacterium RIFCSPHIGHO2_12_FULL_38_14]|nr:MAG: dihydrofolate reductase [Gammaproteobacteria bacterium RIFCSPHIGHO2_12_FULL_38_14]
MIISIIVAFDKNRLIGNHNTLPWHLPADLAYFKKMTMGKPVVMGRKTHESIGKPLPGRRNIVISSTKTFYGCETFSSVEAALAALSSEKEIMVIGGKNIFEQFLPKAQRLYITKIDAEFSGDVYFPACDLSQWEQVTVEKHTPDEKNVYSYCFLIYEK